jgi:hypothetical protein
MTLVYKPKPQRTPMVDVKKVFEVHLEALKDAYKELIDTNFKISGVLLIVLGWLATKENPLGMLCYSSYLTYIALIFIFVGQLLLVYLFRTIYNRAIRSYEMLKILGYDEPLFARYRVTSSMFWAGNFGQFTMLFGIFIFIFYRYHVLLDATCSAVVKIK